MKTRTNSLCNLVATIISLLLFSTLPLGAQNVGIGTLNPEKSLHVAGDLLIDSTLEATEIVLIDNNGDTIFMFNADEVRIELHDGYKKSTKNGIESTIYPEGGGISWSIRDSQPSPNLPEGNHQLIYCVPREGDSTILDRQTLIFVENEEDTVKLVIFPEERTWNHEGTGVFNGLHIESEDCDGWKLEQGFNNDCDNPAFTRSFILVDSTGPIWTFDLVYDLNDTISIAQLYTDGSDSLNLIVRPNDQLWEFDGTGNFEVIEANSVKTDSLYPLTGNDLVVNGNLIHLDPGACCAFVSWPNVKTDSLHPLTSNDLVVNGNVKVDTLLGDKLFIKSLIFPGGFGDTTFYSQNGISVGNGFGGTVGFYFDAFSEMVGVIGALFVSDLLGGNAQFDTVNADYVDKLAGSFKIDHPLDPYNKYLYHSFVESPDMMNIYNGNIVTDATGEALVTLPDYFEALNKEFRYQLTVIGSFAQAIIATEIDNNQFTIMTDKPNVKVSWQVTGIRNDSYAKENRIEVEVEKKQDDKGTLVYNPAIN